MGVDQELNGIGKVGKRFLRKPVRTILLSVILILLLIVVFFFGHGYFTEKGRQLASDNKRHLSSSNAYITPKLVTISNGEIKLPGPGLYLVETEDRADSDELTKILGLSRGDRVILKAADNDRTIAVKEGRFLIMAAYVFYLNNKDDKIIFTSEGNDVCAEDNRLSLGD